MSDELKEKVEEAENVVIDYAGMMFRGSIINNREMMDDGTYRLHEFKKARALHAIDFYKNTKRSFIELQKKAGEIFREWDEKECDRGETMVWLADLSNYIDMMAALVVQSVNRDTYGED